MKSQFQFAELTIQSTIITINNAGAEFRYPTPALFYGKSIGKSGNAGIAQFTGEDDEVMKNYQ